MSMHACTHECMRECMHMYILACMRACTYKYVRVCMITYMRARTLYSRTEINF
uniref:Uncharacterized protein n=1 Tax=Anguilla anguilla TaxID=7936 RepID=A0A0E9PAK5_ANGAN